MQREQIEANYEQLEQIASIFGECTEAMETLVSNLTNTINELRTNGWKGRGEDAFFNELQDDVMPRMKKLCEAMSEANTATSKISEIMSNAEDEAGGLFRR